MTLIYNLFIFARLNISIFIRKSSGLNSFKYLFITVEKRALLSIATSVSIHISIKFRLAKIESLSMDN